MDVFDFSSIFGDTKMFFSVRIPHFLVSKLLTSDLFVDKDFLCITCEFKLT